MDLRICSTLKLVVYTSSIEEYPDILEKSLNFQFDRFINDFILCFKFFRIVYF